MLRGLGLLARVWALFGIGDGWPGGRELRGGLGMGVAAGLDAAAPLSVAVVYILAAWCFAKA